MKDGKYEVGDVIAFRVKRPKMHGEESRKGDVVLYKNNEKETIVEKTMIGRSMYDAILERIPNPKLMDGEWWKGWTLRFIQRGEVAPSGSLFFTGCCGRESGINRWRATDGKGGYLLSEHPRCAENERYALVPPRPDPEPLCPELKAQIDRLETELAELKKQALGE